MKEICGKNTKIEHNLLDAQSKFKMKIGSQHWETIVEIKTASKKCIMDILKRH